MTEDEMNPDICPAALEEDGTLDRTNGPEWGKHRWSEQPCPGEGCHGTTKTCDECGQIRDCDNGTVI